MTLTQPQRIGIFIVLALVMAGTRINHFSALPDASWVVFFAAGFYLRGSMRWAFPALIALAVLLDFLVINGQGLNFWSHYCVSPGYWFLAAAYAAMWLGGSLLRTQASGPRLRTLGLLVPSFLVAEALCFLISNGSFYWTSAAVASPSLAGWIENMGDWYLPYLRTSAMYLCIGTGVHIIAARWLNLLADPAQIHGQRG